MKSKDAEKFMRYYRKKNVTGNYDKQREGTAYRREKRRLELRYFLEMIDKKPKEEILEIGCSSGFLTKHLGEVTAIDTSKEMLEIAYSKNSKAKCIEADMFTLPFTDNSFDKIVTMRVWNHLNKNDLIEVIRESKRVLKKNGYLIFDTEDKSFIRRIVSVLYKILFKPTGYKIYQYSLSEISKILIKEGFKIENVRFLHHRIGRQIIMRLKLIEK